MNNDDLWIVALFFLALTSGIGFAVLFIVKLLGGKL